MMSPYRTFIHLKGVGRLGSKRQKWLSPWRLSSSPSLDPKEEGHPFRRAPGRMVIPLRLSREDGHFLGRAKK
jgi:hypothetical protein